jgi:hypothetical protein
MTVVEKFGGTKSKVLVQLLAYRVPGNECANEVGSNPLEVEANSHIATYPPRYFL